MPFKTNTAAGIRKNQKRKKLEKHSLGISGKENKLNNLAFPLR